MDRNPELLSRRNRATGYREVSLMLVMNRPERRHGGGSGSGCGVRKTLGRRLFQLWRQNMLSRASYRNTQVLLEKVRVFQMQRYAAADQHAFSAIPNPYQATTLAHWLNLYETACIEPRPGTRVLLHSRLKYFSV